ncbi:MAG TPA: ATP-binding cassette domain-containing protein, partial [Phaeodactylibacter sp.]|nr:ATP-binding cassette domain-containing protein [Phaeodactylibacter sp.]
KRWDWERTEAELFRTGMNYRSLHLRQDLGARIIDEVKNIFITVFAAKAVIDGQLSIGGLLAVQYIVGQLQAPIQQLIHFLRMVQDARISLERMQEVQQMAGEEEAEAQADILPDALSLKMVNVTFSYRQGQGAPALKDISVEIPSGKTTAIVGSSGSGKTTLMKLLLGMYQPQEGEVKLGEMPLRNIPSRRWNELCGVVLQDGYIFSDTVARNICLGEDSIDEERLKWAARIANIHGFVESLPLGYNPRLGAEGLGLSQGQRQRILIARAVYKKPSLLFFDEATNALDAYNELIVLENVEDAFPHATTVLIAHRLSTVMNADYIIVLEDGELIEQGTHDELTNARGTYYHLLKNQLELGA